MSLFSYHPGDLVYGLKTGLLGKAHNLFGTVGAHLSRWIFHILGFSSFWLVVFFLVLAFLSFRGNTFLSPVKSIITILFLVVSFSGIVSLQLPEMVIYRGEEVRSGGLAGYYISGFTKGFLNYFGAAVLLWAIFIISLMVCTRLSFSRLFSKISLWFSGVIRRVREYYTKKREKNRFPYSHYCYDCPCSER